MCELGRRCVCGGFSADKAVLKGRTGTLWATHIRSQQGQKETSSFPPFVKILRDLKCEQCPLGDAK